VTQTRIARTFATSAALLLLVAGWAAAGQVNPGAPPMDVVVTTGEAVIKAAPDRAVIMLVVESRASTPQQAQRQNATAMTAVQDKLRSTGLPAEAIRTVGIELAPEYDYIEGRQRLRAYVARNRIEVRVDALDRLGETIDAAVGSGATSMTGLVFDVGRRAELEREALQQAVAQARSRAEAAAAGAGRTIDRVVRVEDLGGFNAPPRPFMAARADIAAEAATPVAPGELEIQARVSLTAALR
jgi:uncharacterized protein YggE